ncbi:MAG: gamma carbonic anhydrase family protein [Myxococcales bacterium]|nr:gamma carbonic anhydrase family protein [Myxococcales bacterium]
MASRTVTDSVLEVAGPPADVDALEAQLDALRLRHPGVIFSRYLAAIPQVDPSCYLAPGAAIVGDVRLGPQASVWFGCVLRGDVNRIEVGARSNLQDGTVVHLGDDDPTLIGEDVVIGHRAVVHGCTIGDGTLVGISATILDGATIGHGSIIGAGAVVTAASEIPPHSLVLGVPAKVVKTLDPSAEDFHRALAGKYTRLAHNYRIG